MRRFNGSSSVDRMRALKKSILPTTVVLVYAAMLLPMAVAIWMSFIDEAVISFPPAGYTWRWYVNAWQTRQFNQGFAVSLEVAFVATVIGVTLGTGAGYALVRARFSGKTIIQGLLLGPLAFPGVVLGTGIYVSYVQIDNAIDLPLVGSLSGLITAHVLLTMPWAVRLVVANLQAMNRSAEEAAANLVARPITVFFRVTLPMMRSGIVAASLFGFIQSFENLDLTLLLTGPGYSTLPIAMMNYLEFRIDPTLAAVATCQIVLVGLMMFIMNRFVNLSRAIA